MKKILILFIMLLFVISSQSIFALSLERNTAFKINKFGILGVALPDSIVQIIIELESSVDDTIRFNYNFNGHMTLSSGTYQEFNELNKNVYLNNSSTKILKIKRALKINFKLG